MDVLSQTIGELRLESAAYAPFALRAPWALRYEPGVRGVHIVRRGRCLLEVPGQAPVALEPLDFVVVPHGLAHLLRSTGARARPRDAAELAASGAYPARHEGSPHGDPAEITCGAFTLGVTVEHPVLAALPHVLHVRASGTSVARHVESLLLEAAEAREGSQAIVARLSDVLLIHAVRAYAASPAARGALGALAHRQVGAALRLLHAEPGAPWTVEGLARAAGASRASFAHHFREQVGASPMTYLTRVRLFHAKRLLAETRAPLKDVASRVGYGSAAALSAAFRRSEGETPGAFRRAQRATTGSRPPRTRSRG